MKTIIDPHLNKIKCPRLTEKESQKKKGDSKRMKIKVTMTRLMLILEISGSEFSKIGFLKNLDLKLKQ